MNLFQAIYEEHRQRTGHQCERDDPRVWVCAVCHALLAHMRAEAEHEADVRQVWHHAERIKCPKCGMIQDASVQHTAPFWCYAHECPCGYWITESEWETVPNAEGESRAASARTLHPLVVHSSSEGGRE